MLLLSAGGWTDGLTASFSFIFASILGVSIIYQARKINAKLLLYMGFNILLVSFFWFGIFLDFVVVISSGSNIIIPNEWMAVLRLIWSPLAFLVSLYIAAELFYPDKKLFLIAPFLVLGIAYVIVVFINPLNNINVTIPGGGLIDVEFIEFSIGFILNYTFLLSAVIFCGFGYLFKGIRSKDIIRRKFLLLSTGYFLFLVFPFMAIFVGDIYTYLIRIGMVIGLLFFYLGLKEAPIEKPREKEIKKEVQVRESLFRLYERPDYITEEEVSFHKEKKICLVCKGSVSRLNYICPKCSALYCDKCADQLSDLENMCWVCDEPFNDTKPARPYKKKKPKDDETPGKT
ncbi:MAG: hypothetical protein ACXADU_00165 [Promethearchaeota archaeon]|jgi:hypothetical protein